jgi:hypothetical protein
MWASTSFGLEAEAAFFVGFVAGAFLLEALFFAAGMPTAEVPTFKSITLAGCGHDRRRAT